MTFLWPEMLWLLLVVPALVAGYFYLLRRKQRRALSYASLSMVKDAMGTGQRFRRHIPPLFFLIALIALIVADRPSRGRDHLAIAAPNHHPRHGCFRQYARQSTCSPIAFPRRRPLPKPLSPSSPRTYASAWCPSPPRRRSCRSPTQNREDIVGAIDRFQLQRGTAIGSGIIVSLATIFPGCRHRRQLVDLRA